jgi:hypothetical protein
MAAKIDKNVLKEDLQKFFAERELDLHDIRVAVSEKSVSFQGDCAILKTEGKTDHEQ